MGFFLFACAVLYVVSKRIGLLKLQRAVTAAIKAGAVRQAENGPRVVDSVNQARVHNDPAKLLEAPLERALRDEL